MAMYRKKPVVVEAEQYVARGIFVRGMCQSPFCVEAGLDEPHVHTIHSNQAVRLEVGDFIIPEPDGEHYYPCKPDIFAATYEPAETERLPDVEAALQPCGYCEKHVEAPCTDGSQAQACYRQPPDTSDIPETSADWFEKAKLVEAMPPGARADAMRHDPEWRAQPIGPAGIISDSDYQHPNQRATRFRDEIEQVINSHSRENGSGTPDFVLAQFVLDVMDAFDRAVTRRQGWYGRPTDEKALIKMLKERLQAEGEHTAAGQAEIEQLNAAIRLRDEQLNRAYKVVDSLEADNTRLRGELQRVSMAGLAPSMVVGK